jgi:hypothetical protein
MGWGQERLASNYQFTVHMECIVLVNDGYVLEALIYKHSNSSYKPQT